jgi:hypothetical protein
MATRSAIPFRSRPKYAQSPKPNDFVKGAPLEQHLVKVRLAWIELALAVS